MDLHMHSRYSIDGEFMPQRLIELCAAEGIGIVSVTDHNCVRANPEAAEAAHSFGISYVPGIEIDCTFNEVNFHMLGYGIDYKSGDFEEIEENINRQCRRVSLEYLRKTRALGFDISEEELDEAASDCIAPYYWTGEMFAQVLLAKPEYSEHPLLMPYRAGGSRSDNPCLNFYWDMYSQGKPCYAKTEYPKLTDIVKIIGQNHGIAVLAHPGANIKGDMELLRGVIETGIDGIEAYSSYHSSEQNEIFAHEARQRGIIITCGSDFHGETKPAIRIGNTGVDKINVQSMRREFENRLR